MREIEEEKLRELEEMGQNYNIKYDEDCQEINQKVEMVEKERDYFREKCGEREAELGRRA